MEWEKLSQLLAQGGDVGASSGGDQLRLWSKPGPLGRGWPDPRICAGTSQLSPLPRTLCSCPPPPDPWSPFSFGEEPRPCRHVTQGFPARRSIRESPLYTGPPQAPTPCHTQLGWDCLNVSTNDFNRFDFLFISKAHKSMVKNLT